MLFLQRTREVRNNIKEERILQRFVSSDITVTGVLRCFKSWRCCKFLAEEIVKSGGKCPGKFEELTPHLWASNGVLTTDLLMISGKLCLNQLKKVNCSCGDSARRNCTAFFFIAVFIFLHWIGEKGSGQIRFDATTRGRTVNHHYFVLKHEWWKVEVSDFDKRIQLFLDLVCKRYSKNYVQ